VPVAWAKGELVAGVKSLEESSPVEGTLGADAENVMVPVRSAVVKGVVDAEVVLVPVG
jgi:hypothetical protein